MSSQNVDYEVGEGITVDGPSTLVVPNYDSAGTAEYMVKAYTINKSYSWSVEGATLQDTTRGGEVAIAATADSSAEYTVSVTTTVDGQEVSGSASGAAKYPDASAQLAKYNNLSTFQSVASAAGVAGVLGNRDTTAVVPTNTAFLEALDGNDNDEIEDAEMPESGVLAQILQYHVIPGETLRSGDISDGQTVTTAFGAELEFSTGGDLTVQGDASSASYVAPDIATDGPALLRIDGVLLPSAAASINDQTATEGANTDTVDVAGVYLSEGGYIVLHEASSGDVIGNSDYLDPGFYGNTGPVPVALDNQLSADTTEVVAMPHRDNGDMVYGFPATDGPYTYTPGGAPVTDTASVVAP